MARIRPLATGMAFPALVSRLLLPGIETTIHLNQATKDCVACDAGGDH